MEFAYIYQTLDEVLENFCDFFLQVSVSSTNEISGIDILYGWLFSLLGKISDWNMSDWWETAKREKKMQGWPARYSVRKQFFDLKLQMCSFIWRLLQQFLIYLVQNESIADW